ncbi:hypothetical protein ACP3V3_16725 [Vibrio sp. PNB22_3_1]
MEIQEQLQFDYVASVVSAHLIKTDNPRYLALVAEYTDEPQPYSRSMHAMLCARLKEEFKTLLDSDEVKIGNCWYRFYGDDLFAEQIDENNQMGKLPIGNVGMDPIWLCLLTEEVKHRPFGISVSEDTLTNRGRTALKEIKDSLDSDDKPSSYWDEIISNNWWRCKPLCVRGHDGKPIPNWYQVPNYSNERLLMLFNDNRSFQVKGKKNGMSVHTFAALCAIRIQESLPRQ